jgi:hypothetical protein
MKTRNGASKTTSEIDDKNQIEEQFISSQSFHRTPDGRVRKITVEVQFEPRNLESFDPVTQELYQTSPYKNSHKNPQEQSENFNNSRCFCSCLSLRMGEQTTQQHRATIQASPGAGKTQARTEQETSRANQTRAETKAVSQTRGPRRTRNRRLQETKRSRVRAEYKRAAHQAEKKSRANSSEPTSANIKEMSQEKDEIWPANGRDSSPTGRSQGRTCCWTENGIRKTVQENKSKRATPIGAQ